MKRRMLATLVVSFCVFGGTSAQAQSHGYTFDIDETLSQLTLDIAVDTLFGNDSGSDTTFVDGTIDATLNPASGAFTDIHITSLEVQALDDLMIALSIPGVGDLDLTVQNLELRTPYLDAVVGPATTVDPAGNFTQTGNTVKMLGTVLVTGGSSVDLVDQNPTALDFAGTVTDDGTLVTLAFPNIASTTVITEGLPTGVNSVTIQLTGNIVATADTVPEPLTMSLLGLGTLGLLRRRRR